jgi:two-component system, LytTR family, sensor kinase
VYFVRPGNRPRPFGEVVASELMLVVMWIPLTVGIFWLTGRFPLERGKWARHGAVHALGCAFVIACRAVLVFVFDPWFGFYDSRPAFAEVIVHSVYNNFFFYWLQAGVAHALVFSSRERKRERMAAELERELARAELDALKAKLHPHFLFNTLHSISALVHVDAEAADRMIARLSELLRQVLDHSATQEVPLAEELRCLRAYLEIERARLGERLRVVEDVEEEALGALVPHWVLQPLVENAVRHGIAPRAAPGQVTIAARRDGDRLCLSVRDNGVGLRHESRVSEGGLGIATTRARLRRLYGEAQELELVPSPDGGAATLLVVPFHRATVPHGGRSIVDPLRAEKRRAGETRAG